MAARGGPKGPARTEAREANKGGIHDIGKGLSASADKNDGAMQDAFAKHNASKGHQNNDGHAPFAKS